MTSMPNTTASSATARADALAADAAAFSKHSSPLSIPYQPVSGRYRGRQGDFEVELRIDVDGARPMNRVSADYFHLRDDEHLYAGSMRVDAPAVVSNGSLLTITGEGRSSWHPDASTVRVTIPRSRPGTPPANATLTHVAASGKVRARWQCTYESASFRRALLEEAVQPGVQRFGPYDTGSLPAGCSPRTITHISAFADAGIEMVRRREPEVLSSPDVATNASWSDAELHAAMMRHFSAFGDIPQWAVWLLHARLHDQDRGAAVPRLYGLMFDRSGRQRQGCALFYQGMAGSSPQRQRTQLFTCVHELGHGFNLLHSFQKSLALPPLPSRPASATWMAYPYLFPAGESEFWRRFAFEFDDPELVHLRHAFRDDVIMGGSPFAAGAAFEEDEVVPSEDPGLRLTLSAQPALLYGVPVIVDFELAGTTREGRRAPSCLGPRPGNVDIEIREANQEAVLFEPLLRHCIVDEGVVLRAGDPPVRDSAFIHYGKDGFAFDRPGRYEIRARCAVPGGLYVLSNVVQIEVKAPVTRADRAAADLVLGDDQGALMSLVGSDAPALRQGDEALRTVVERFPGHPLAAVPRIVRATNAAREFKAIRLDGSIKTREALPQAAAAILHRTPRLEARLRADAVGSDEAALPHTFKQLLSGAPTDALHPFVRSRVGEIAAVLPQVLASTQPVPASTESVWQRPGAGGWRTRSP